MENLGLRGFPLKLSPYKPGLRLQVQNRAPTLGLTTRRTGCVQWCIIGAQVVYQVVGYYVTIGSVQVVRFFDVAAPLCAGDGPIPALVAVSEHR